AGFDNPTGAIVAPKAKRTLRYVLRKRREGDSHWAGTLKRPSSYRVLASDCHLWLQKAGTLTRFGVSRDGG
ncbi:MAG: hypothetical protein KDE53_15235, partial [Caldilineaceae bacterium]|nr:hypothetical protein [Caldilineaceae bacterium]